MSLEEKINYTKICERITALEVKMNFIVYISSTSLLIGLSVLMKVWFGV
jgi:hypothetical protein